MTPLTNGFVLETLSIVASGYIIHGALVCRILPKSANYILYFRIIVIGISFTLFTAIVLYSLPLSNTISSPWLGPEYVPVLVFPLAIFFRLITEAVVCAAVIFGLDGFSPTMIAGVPYLTWLLGGAGLVLLVFAGKR